MPEFRSRAASIPIPAVPESSLPLAQVVAEKAEQPKKRKDQTIKTLTEREVEGLFAVIRAPRDRALFRLIYHRGLRRSEVGMLSLSDYRPAEGRLYVHRKKRSRSGEYLLTQVEQKVLRGWVKVRGDAPGPLFPSREHRLRPGRGQSASAADRNAIAGRTVQHLFAQYCALAGIPRSLAHVHVLKHSCVTHIADLLEGDILAVQDHVGHADVRSTMEYMKFRRRDQVARRIETWGEKVA